MATPAAPGLNVVVTDLPNASAVMEALSRHEGVQGGGTAPPPRLAAVLRRQPKCALLRLPLPAAPLRIQYNVDVVELNGRVCGRPSWSPPQKARLDRLHTLAAVLELYTEWAGPTTACKSTWRKAALERGGEMPANLFTACVDKCGGVPGLEPYMAAPTSQPVFLFFKGGRTVAEVRGVNPPALLKELAAAEGSGPAAVVRESECC